MKEHNLQPSVGVMYEAELAIITLNGPAKLLYQKKEASGIKVTSHSKEGFNYIDVWPIIKKHNAFSYKDTFLPTQGKFMCVTKDVDENKQVDEVIAYNLRSIPTFYGKEIIGVEFTNIQLKER